MKEASCLALFSITYHEERAVNCLKKWFFSLAEGNWKRRANWNIIIYCALKGLRNLYVLIVPEIFVDRCPRNFSGPLFQKFLWILVSEISADESLSQKFLPDESLSQKFLRVSRCQRNFCGSWKLYFLSCVFINVLQTSETTVINAYTQETNKFWNILP